MSRKAKPVPCSEEQRGELKRIANSRTEMHERVERARIVLECIEGKQIKDIAASQKQTPLTVRKWRDRFIAGGIDGLADLPRSGKPVTYDAQFRNRVLEKTRRATSERLGTLGRRNISGSPRRIRRRGVAVVT